MSRRIIVLAAVGVAICGYFVLFKDRDDLIYLFALSLVVLVLAYVFQFQLDQLITRGVPQQIDPAVRDMLLHTSSHYIRMDPVRRQMAEDRMRRWIMRKEFINKNEQDAPEDVKYILAWYAILLTMHQEAFLYDGLDRIVFYHHPFLTPTHPDDVHIAEVESVDGTMIISVPHVIRGHMEKGIFNIALYMIAEAYATCYLKETIDWPEDIWDRLEEISSIPRERIAAYIGLPVDDPWPVAVHHQLMYAGAEIPEVELRLGGSGQWAVGMGQGARSKS